MYIVRALLRDRIGEIIRESFRRIVSHLQSIDAAHVTGCARGNEHVTCGQRIWRSFQIELFALRLKQNAVTRLFIDFDLRVIRPHVTLSTGARQTRDLD